MKNTFVVMLSLFMITALFSCSAAKDAETPESIDIVYSTAHAMLDRERCAFSLDELEEKSIVIAKVTVLEGSYEVLNDELTEQIGDVVWKFGSTITPVRFDVVYKNDGKAKEGNTYEIQEYYTRSYSPKYPDKVYIATFEGYMPMVPGEQYILFLRPAQAAGDYETCSIQMGKYVCNDTMKNASKVSELMKEDLEILNDSTKDPVYWNTAQSVRDKYMQ